MVVRAARGSANDGQPVQKAKSDSHARVGHIWYLCATADKPSIYSEQCQHLPRGDGHPAAIIGDKTWALSKRDCCGCLPAAGRLPKTNKCQLLPCSLDLVGGI